MLKNVLEKLKYLKDCIPSSTIISLLVSIQTTMSTSHALINITSNIRKALDDGNLPQSVEYLGVKIDTNLS